MGSLRHLVNRIERWITRHTSKFFPVLTFAVFFNCVAIMWLTIPPENNKAAKNTGICFVAISTLMIIICIFVFSRALRSRSPTFEITSPSDESVEDGLSVRAQTMSTPRIESVSLRSYSSTAPLTNDTSGHMSRQRNGQHPDAASNTCTIGIITTTTYEQMINKGFQQDPGDLDSESSAASHFSATAPEELPSEITSPPRYTAVVAKGNEVGVTYVTVSGQSPPSDEDVTSTAKSELVHSMSHTFSEEDDRALSIPVSSPNLPESRFIGGQSSSTLIKVGPGEEIVEDHKTEAETAESSHDTKPPKPEVNWKSFPKLKPSLILQDFKPKSLDSGLQLSPSTSTTQAQSPSFRRSTPETIDEETFSQVDSGDNSDDPEIETVTMSMAIRSETQSENDYAASPSPSPEMSADIQAAISPPLAYQDSTEFDSSSVESLHMDANLSSDSSIDEGYDFLNASSIFKGSKDSSSRKLQRSKSSESQLSREGRFRNDQADNSSKAQSVYDDALLSPSLIGRIYSESGKATNPWTFPETSGNKNNRTTDNRLQGVAESSAAEETRIKGKSRNISSGSSDEEWVKVE